MFCMVRLVICAIQFSAAGSERGTICCGEEGLCVCAESGSAPDVGVYEELAGTGSGE